MNMGPQMETHAFMTLKREKTEHAIKHKRSIEATELQATLK